MKLPAYSETAPKTNMMQERSQMPMEVIPEKKVFVKNEASFLKEGQSFIPMFKI